MDCVRRHRQLLTPPAQDDDAHASSSSSYGVLTFAVPRTLASAPPDIPDDAHLFRLDVGDYSHWNVREGPSTSTRVVHQKRNGDIAAVLQTSGGWLQTAEGWVRAEQGSGGWSRAHMVAAAVPAMQTKELELTGTSEPAQPTRLRMRASQGRLLVHCDCVFGAGCSGGPALPGGTRTVAKVEFDGGRGLLLPELNVQVALRWESLPTVLGCLRAILAAATSCDGSSVPACGAYCSVAQWDDAARAGIAATSVAAEAQAAAADVATFSGAAFRWSAPCQFLSPRASRSRRAGGVPDAAQRRRLRRFFQFYRPEKLPSVVPTLLALRGDEERMFKRLVEKYGPEPPDAGDGPLRPGWREVENGHGDIFYVHAGGAKQWARPSEFLTDGTVWPLLNHEGPPV